MTRRRLAWAVATAVPLGYLAVLFAYPVGSILARGFGEGDVVAVMRRRSVGRVLWFTTWQAALSTVVTLAIGLPAAWAVARLDVPGRRLLRALMVVPFVLPTLVVGAALGATFDAVGLGGPGFDLNGTVAAIVIAHAMLNVAIVVRVVGGFWALVDPRTAEAARVLGASRRRVLREVVLVELAPALRSAVAIVFLFCFTSFGVILTVGGPTNPTLETEIWRYAVRRTDFGTASALAAVQLLAVLAMVVASGRLERRAPGGVGVAARRPVPPRPLRSTADLAVACAALLPALALVAVPMGVLVERSLSTGGGHGLDHYRALGSPAGTGLSAPASEAVVASLGIAAVAAALAVGVGALASVVVVHGGRRLGPTVDTALMLPLGTSAVTVGFGMLVALDSPPLDLRTSWWIVPLAQSLVGVPFVVRSMVPALGSVDVRQREAAAVLGASPGRVRWEVDAPVASRAVLVGAAFAFAVSLGEFGATSFLARPETTTVPVAMFRLLGRPGEALQGQAMALGVILAVVTALSVLVIERLRPRDALGW